MGTGELAQLLHLTLALILPEIPLAGMALKP